MSPVFPSNKLVEYNVITTNKDYGHNPINPNYPLHLLKTRFQSSLITLNKVKFQKKPSKNFNLIQFE